MDSILTWINDLPAWINALTGLVAAATAVTMLTPTKRDDVIIQFFLTILNFASGNFLRNKNADE